MVAAAWEVFLGLYAPGRKVRTPQGSVLGNAQAWKRDGQCNREETAGRVPRRGPPRDAPHGAAGKGETVR